MVHVILARNFKPFSFENFGAEIQIFFLTKYLGAKFQIFIV